MSRIPSGVWSVGSVAWCDYFLYLEDLSFVRKMDHNFFDAWTT